MPRSKWEALPSHLGCLLEQRTWPQCQAAVSRSKQEALLSHPSCLLEQRTWPQCQAAPPRFKLEALPTIPPRPALHPSLQQFGAGPARAEWLVVCVVMLQEPQATITEHGASYLSCLHDSICLRSAEPHYHEAAFRTYCASQAPITKRRVGPIVPR